ncbi:MAG TPA: DUF3501 family protein [Candidatus Methylomirabilis sp.]|nr:DUF3501 family protein [Candidatus Methylomirabilis sp.]
MQKISRSDVRDLVQYEKIRDEMRRRLIALKRSRRVPVGDRLTFLLENRDTVLFQIQEMIRTERMVDEEKILEEIEINNELIPGERELSATMFIEVDEPGRIREVLDRLQGIDRGEHVYFQIGERFRVMGVFESGRSKEDKISAVHYVKFPFSEAARDAFLGLRVPVELVVDHPRYKERTKIDGETRQRLIEDLTA